MVSSIFTTIAISVASVLFALARILLPVLYKLPFLPFVLRPLTGHFLRGPWTFSLPLRHFGLLLRAWFLGFTTFISWEIAECLFEKIVAEVKSYQVLSPVYSLMFLRPPHYLPSRQITIQPLSRVLPLRIEFSSSLPMLSLEISPEPRPRLLRPVERPYLVIKNIFQIFGLSSLGKVFCY